MTDQQVTTTVDEAVPQQLEAPEQRPSEPDPLAAAAVDLARRAAEDVAQPGTVGRHLSVSVDSSGLTMHAFDSTAKGYRGWRWAVTLAHVPGSDRVTVCDTVLLPGAESIMAPDWVPWSDRLAPGDLGAGDELPFKLEDPYLVPGYTVTDEEDADQELFWELGLGRERVLGPEGITAAADRWHRGSHGPTAEIAIQASASCVTCAYFVPLSGVMRQAFGACANEWSPADGSVVTADFGCGAHSETDLEMPAPEPLGEHILDETVVDRMDLEAVEVAEPGPGIETGSTTDAEVEGAVTEVAAVFEDAAGDLELTEAVESVESVGSVASVRDAGGTSKDVVPAESAPPVAIEFEPTLDPEPVASPEDVVTVRPLNEAPAQQTESVDSARTASDEMIQGGVVASGGSAEVESVEIEVAQVEVAQATPGGQSVRPEPENEPVAPPSLIAEVAAGQPGSAVAPSTEVALGQAVEAASEYTEFSGSADSAVLGEGLAVPGQTVLESGGVLAGEPAVDHVRAGEVGAGEPSAADVEDAGVEADPVGDGVNDQDESASAGDVGDVGDVDDVDGSHDAIAIDSAVAAAEPDPVAQPVIEAAVQASGEASGPAEGSGPLEAPGQVEAPSRTQAHAQTEASGPVGASGVAEASGPAEGQGPGEVSDEAHGTVSDVAPAQTMDGVPGEVSGETLADASGESLNTTKGEVLGGDGKPETEVPSQP